MIGMDHTNGSPPWNLLNQPVYLESAFELVLVQLFIYRLKSVSASISVELLIYSKSHISISINISTNIIRVRQCISLNTAIYIQFRVSPLNQYQYNCFYSVQSIASILVSVHLFIFSSESHFYISFITTIYV